MKVLSVRILLIVVLGLMVTACSVAASAAPSPDQVITQFYEPQLRGSGQTSGKPVNLLADTAYRSNQYLAPDFIQKVDRIIAGFDKGGYSPFLCAQDVPSNITLDPAQVSGNQASVEVHTSFPGHAFTVQLKALDGKWKIADIVCHQGGEPYSLGINRPSGAIRLMACSSLPVVT